MLDQANNLRRKMKTPRVVSVVSGKGGVGKSNLSLNFALALKKLGKKVILFDLDIGMANLDILMGLLPSRTIVDMVEENLSIWEIIEHGTGGLSYIAGGSGLSEVFRLDERKTEHFLRELGCLQKEYDTVIFDMGAGVSDDLLKFVLASDEAIVVTTPEPTAMTDAYAAMKFICRAGVQLPVRIVVNRSRSEKEGRETAVRLQQVADRFLNQKIRAFSVLPDDNTVPNAVRAGIPFLLYAPRAPVTKAVLDAAQAWSGLPSSGGGFLRKLRNYFHPGKERIL
ncbi:MAG TPA: MinD/ParA family protein [Bacillales bacterium]|nr:MinD/ParA family protein [Bacillales bacterium]